MKTYLMSRNYRELPVFMPAEALSSDVGQVDRFNVKENESTKDIFYSFTLPLNKSSNGFWIDRNTNDLNFNAEDTTKIVKSFYFENKWKANVLLAVQDPMPDTVIDDKQYTRLKAMLQEEIAESGMTNPSEEIVESLYSENKQKTNILLNELFLKNFHAPHVIVGILHIISHFDYDLVSPEGPVMAIAALAHKDVEVKEYGVKCFENWQHKDGIGILEKIETDEPWLQNYIDLVICDLETLK